MLRTTFVLLIVAFGLRHAVRGPFYAVMFYLWIAYFRPELWVWDGLVQSLPLSLYAGLLVVLMAVVTGQMFRLSTRGLLCVLFVAHSLISTIASPYRDFGWPYWTDFLKSTLITYLLCVLVDSVSRLRLAFIVITLSLGFEAAKNGWAQLIVTPGTKNWNEIASLGDNNGVAVGMFMLVPVMVALIQTAQRKWERYALLFMIFGIIYRGISTYSRGGLIACAVMALFYMARSKRKIRTFLLVTATAAVIAPVLSGAYWERMSSIRLPGPDEDFTKETSADDSSTMGRMHFWAVAIHMAQTHPLLGIGHNSFVAAYDDYDDLSGAFGHRRAVHSSWLAVLAELGFTGFFLFLLIFGLAIAGTARVLRLARHGPDFADLVPYAIALQMGLVVFAVGGAFVSVQYVELLWHFLGLSIALSRIAQVRLRAKEESQAGQRIVFGQLPTQGVA